MPALLAATLLLPAIHVALTCPLPTRAHYWGLIRHSKGCLDRIHPQAAPALESPPEVTQITTSKRRCEPTEPGVTCMPISYRRLEVDPPNRETHSSKRHDWKPNSLDLTFHLLREVMELSRAEQLMQKVLSNRHILEAVGK